MERKAGASIKRRWDWAGEDPLYQRYHHEEWGVPVHDDRTLFEFLTLEGAPIRNRWRAQHEVPASAPESDALSRNLKRRGFRFVGSTICYAFMQAVGMVNDHLVHCHRYRELNKASRPSA